MRFSADWLQPGDSTSPELKATACLLAIDVSGTRVSQFVDRRQGTVSERIVMPAYPLAEGLVKHWWFLLAGRSDSLSLRKIREGFAVPDVRFEPDGREMRIIAKPSNYRNPEVSFFGEASEIVPIDLFERDVTSFIFSVLRRLETTGLYTILEDRWNRIQQSLSDNEERAFCEAAGALGIDPYTCDADEATAIEVAAGCFTGEALLEFLAGQQSEDVTAGTEWVIKQEQAIGARTDVPHLVGLADEVRGGMNGTDRAAAWKVGTHAAKLSRSILSHDDLVFQNASALAELLGNPEFDVAPTRAKGLRACVSSTGGPPRVLVGRSPYQASNLFALARAVGDFVVFGGQRSPITDTVSYRQAVGRAFAAEFLAPADVIISMISQGKTVEDVAAARGVDEPVIVHQLQNNADPSLRARC